MSERVLVTGAAGFIGNHLSYELMKSEIPVICLDNFNSYYDVNLKQARLGRLENLSASLNLEEESYKFIKLDLRDREALFSLFKKFKISSICHLAAQAGVRYSLTNPESYIDNNIDATLNLLEVSKKLNISNFVFASTSSVYGLNKPPFSEELQTNTPMSPYAASKASCELLCHTYSHLYNINIKVLRFFTVYGSWGRPDMALFLFTKAILENKPITIFNHGKMFRDFTHVNDIVKGIMAAMRLSVDFEIMNLGSGKTVELGKYIELLESCLGLEAKKVYEDIQPGDVESTSANISKAKKLLKYDPKKEVEFGVPDFVKWYKDYYEV